MSTLFVVATPIGNLEDISARALRVLHEVTLIAAEDTRVARRLLTHFEIHQRLVSYNENNHAQRLPLLLNALANGDVALVTDAGTPAISDPGTALVAEARVAGHEVVAVPGPSSVVAALSVAGLETARFTFVGFLPRQTSALYGLLTRHRDREEALVALESPQRLRTTLAALDRVLTDRTIAVCRELTKLHEEVFVGTAAQALAHFTEPRGEIVLVVEGTTAPAFAPSNETAERALIDEMKAQGLTRAQATALLATLYKTPRRRAYQLWLEA